MGQESGPKPLEDIWKDSLFSCYVSKFPVKLKLDYSCLDFNLGQLKASYATLQVKKGHFAKNVVPV